MVDVSAIAGTVSALKGAMDITKAMVGLHDVQTMQTKVIELNAKIIDAQSSALAANEERATLIERISKLEKEVVRLETWDTEKQKYDLKEVYHGAFAYVLKPEASSAEPAHWLCATCYADRKKSVLQYFGRAPGNHSASLYKCQRHGCGAFIRVDYKVSPSGGPETPY